MYYISKLWGHKFATICYIYWRQIYDLIIWISNCSLILIFWIIYKYDFEWSNKRDRIQHLFWCGNVLIARFIRHSKQAQQKLNADLIFFLALDRYMGRLAPHTALPISLSSDKKTMCAIIGTYWQLARVTLNRKKKRCSGFCFNLKPRKRWKSNSFFNIGVLRVCLLISWTIWVHWSKVFIIWITVKWSYRTI